MAASLIPPSGGQTFRLPVDLKNDIIYCQRALRSRLKVHQLVINKPHCSAMKKNKYIKEIEDEIYEINAEQQYLFIQVRLFIDHWMKNAADLDTQLDVSAINTCVAKELMPWPSTDSVHMEPISVKMRSSEEALIMKYFSAGKPQVCEKFNSANDEEIGGTKLQKSTSIDPLKISASSSNKTSNNSKILLKKESSLKPITPDETAGISKANKNLVRKLKQKSGLAATEHVKVNKVIPKENDKKPHMSKIKMSRWYLQQALKKARTDVVAGKAPSYTIGDLFIQTSKVFSMPLACTPSADSSNHEGAPKIDSKSSKKVIPKSKPKSVATRKTRTVQKSIEPSSVCSPPQLPLSRGSIDGLTMPEHCSQKTFLSLFELYPTDEVLARKVVLQQQRLVKSTRRAVPNKYYSGIDKIQLPAKQKKRKELLKPPQAKRKVETKSSNAATTSSYRNPARPERKRICLECSQGGGVLEQCKNCRNFYHQNCHLKENVDPAAGHSKQLKQWCPSCKEANDQLKYGDLEYSLTSSEVVGSKPPKQTAKAVLQSQKTSPTYMTGTCRPSDVVNNFQVPRRLGRLKKHPE